MSQRPLRTKAVFNPQNMKLEFDPEGDPTKPWVTTVEHTFCDGVIYHEVPCGFRCDLTSYPRRLGYFLLVGILAATAYPPLLWVISIAGALGLLIMDPHGKEQRAALHHDEAYSTKMSRFKADAMYRVIMEVDRVKAWRVYVNYLAVRCFGWSARMNRKQAKDVTARCYRWATRRLRNGHKN